MGVTGINVTNKKNIVKKMVLFWATPLHPIYNNRINRY